MTLPANPFVTVFDFRLHFNLADGTINIDLSPSTIVDASGIKGVKVSIKKPDNTIIDSGNYAFTPANINSIYTVFMPMVLNSFMWGVYTVTLTLSFVDVAYADSPLTKTRNLCAPNGDDPYSNDMKGSIQLSVDCIAGTLMARGFCGYAYMGIPPSSETYNITRYYPPEAELLPQKGISVMPFSVDAYTGLNKVSGLNLSYYDFTDNVFATVRIVATTEKNVRCGADMDAIYCGMASFYDQLAACNASQQEFNNAFGEINALLWLTTAGVSENKDVEPYIDRLEKLLGIECGCASCGGLLAGTKVGPAPAPPGTVFRADWGWSPTPITNASVLTFAWQKMNPEIEKYGDIVGDFTQAPVNTSYYAFRYPKTEPLKTTWFNIDGTNDGDLPDTVFAVFEDSDFRYVYSKVMVTMDNFVKTITLKT